MIEVNLRSDPDTLLGGGAPEAKAAEAVVLELVAQLSLVCGASKLRWKLSQAQPGNSFSLLGPNQVQFHFRPSPGGVRGIKVYDKPSQGKQVATLSSRNEARAFAKSLLV